MPNYWLVSLPLGRGGRGQTWELLQEKTSYGQQLSSNAKLEVPELRVGTLDTLLQHSDDLAKTSLGTEAIVGKLRRTIHDVGGPQAVSALKVENLPVESYLTRFRWVQRHEPHVSGTSRCCAGAAAGHERMSQQQLCCSSITAHTCLSWVLLSSHHATF
jgi:hypothetical protein